MPSFSNVRLLIFVLACAANLAFVHRAHGQPPLNTARPVDEVRADHSTAGRISPPRRSTTAALPTREQANAPSRKKLWDDAPDLLTVMGSLIFVLGLFFLLAKVVRRGMPKGSGMLPSGVVEVLGRAPLGGKQFVHLVRCGPKLLLIHITPTGAETLTEITDPLEVDRLLGVCHQADPNSVTAAFQQVIQQFGREADTTKFDDADGGSRRRRAEQIDV